jgi:hypothetical protein
MIYLIHNKDSNTCKIGYSKAPAERLRQLQTSNHSKLELTINVEGSQAEEKQLHKKYAHLRLNGEWFQFDQAMVTDLENIVPAISKPKSKFVRMIIRPNGESWATKCDHIGEVKVFSYILATFNRNDTLWTMSPEKLKALAHLYDIQESTIYKYLKNLVSKGLLFKAGRGHYRVSDEFIDYGPKQK